jgi:parvulin-like peptidyl-prolyl isomerase
VTYNGCVTKGRLPAAATLALTAALGALCACSGGDGADPVVLRLGRQVVRRSDFQRHLSALQARGMDAVDPQTGRALIETFVEERVLVLEARTRGYVGAAGTVDDEERAVQRLLTDDVLTKVSPSRDELQAYYQSHLDEFTLQEMAVVRQILVGTANEARDIRRRVLQDPKNFEILARTLSRSPEAAQGGLLGRFARGELPPELDRVAFSLAPRTQTEIVVTPHGHHVVRVDERTPRRVLSFEECAARVEALVRRQKQEHAVRQFVRELLARAEVNYEVAQTALHHP